MSLTGGMGMASSMSFGDDIDDALPLSARSRPGDYQLPPPWLVHLYINPLIYYPITPHPPAPSLLLISLYHSPFHQLSHSPPLWIQHLLNETLDPIQTRQRQKMAIFPLSTTTNNSNIRETMKERVMKEKVKVKTMNTNLLMSKRSKRGSGSWSPPLIVFLLVIINVLAIVLVRDLGVSLSGWMVPRCYLRVVINVYDHPSFLYFT